MFPDKEILLFDGECSFCAASVQFILKHEREQSMQFAALKSEAGRKLCHSHGIDCEKIESLVLIKNDKALIRSDAVLAIARQLGGIWPAAIIFRLIPTAWRDRCYDFIARNRHRWFGQKTACFLPSEKTKNRFLS
jgi:predicted DCC family thiol-disulfide oxidoreductase YuxK